MLNGYPVVVALDWIKESNIFENLSSNDLYDNSITNHIMLTGTIGDNLELTRNTYIFNKIMIAEGAELVVPAGAVLLGIQGEGYIEVLGKLAAYGTDANPIVFTTIKDIELGGTGVVDDYDCWIGICIRETGELNGNYIKLRNGGYYNLDNTFINSALYVEGSLLLDHSVISNSIQEGIRIDSGKDVIIKNSVIEGSRFDNININKIRENSLTGAITIENSTISNGAENGLTIFETELSELTSVNNVISGNGMAGINFIGHGIGKFELSNNQINNNGSYPVIITLDEIKSSIVFAGVHDNLFSGNTSADYVMLTGTVNENLSLRSDRYVIENIRVSEERVLDIQPGTAM